MRAPVAWLLLLGGCSATPAVPGDVREGVVRALAPAGGAWGVYFKDLRTGAELALDADREFHPASTLKVWVMVKVYEDASRGAYSLDDKVAVTNTFPSAARKDPRPFATVATAEAMRQAVGHPMSLRELIEHMITASDNLATNNLILKAGGPEAIRDCLARHGVTRSGVRRYIMDDQAFREGLSSAACPREFGLIFEKLARGEVVSPDASRDMLRVLSRVKARSMLPGQLPPEARVAHKTGNIGGVRCDAGLVTLPSGRRYVAAFFSAGLADGEAGEACLAAASRVLYDFVSR